MPRTNRVGVFLKGAANMQPFFKEKNTEIFEEISDNNGEKDIERKIMKNFLKKFAKKC